ncbi:MAG: IPTL-CTERM sorting domain-containing protein [Comamonadaceae bacterium]|nr:MAG: IPTL-CTERM sorting domain-containing protein [Comamonadaceae bacterium]
MKNKLAGLCAIGAMLAGMGGTASALPVHWTVGPSTFHGITISGSFVHDPDTNAYSQVNLSRSSASLPTTTFRVEQNEAVFQGNPVFFPRSVLPGSFDGVEFLMIGGTPPFTNAGGALSLYMRTGTCGRAWCDTQLAASAGMVAFSGRPLVTSSASIPTLSEWALIALSSLIALATVVSIRRR